MRFDWGDIYAIGNMSRFRTTLRGYELNSQKNVVAYYGPINIVMVDDQCKWWFPFPLDSAFIS